VKITSNRLQDFHEGQLSDSQNSLREKKKEFLSLLSTFLEGFERNSAQTFT
jgi:hypothetical protein